MFCILLCYVYVGYRRGTGPVPELGAIFRPVPELGPRQPRLGTVPARGVFFVFFAPRAGTGRPVPARGVQLKPRIVTGPMVAPVPNWGTLIRH